MADDGTVGYRKPPRWTRFQKGRSGNPKGRPKRARSLAQEIENELNERTMVREGNVAHRIPKRRALAKSLVAQAVKGEAKALAAILDLTASEADRTGPNSPDATSARDSAEVNASAVKVYERMERIASSLAELCLKSEDGQLPALDQALSSVMGRVVREITQHLTNLHLRLLMWTGDPTKTMPDEIEIRLIASDGTVISCGSVPLPRRSRGETA